MLPGGRFPSAGSYVGQQPLSMYDYCPEQGLGYQQHGSLFSSNNAPCMENSVAQQLPQFQQQRRVGLHNVGDIPMRQDPRQQRQQQQPRHAFVQINGQQVIFPLHEAQRLLGASALLNTQQQVYNGQPMQMRGLSDFDAQSLALQAYSGLLGQPQQQQTIAQPVKEVSFRPSMPAGVDNLSAAMTRPHLRIPNAPKLSTVQTYQPYATNAAMMPPVASNHNPLILQSVAQATSAMSPYAQQQALANLRARLAVNGPNNVNGSNLGVCAPGGSLHPSWSPNGALNNGGNGFGAFARPQPSASPLPLQPQHFLNSGVGQGGFLQTRNPMSPAHVKQQQQQLLTAGASSRLPGQLNHNGMLLDLSALQAMQGLPGGGGYGGKLSQQQLQQLQQVRNMAPTTTDTLWSDPSAYAVYTAGAGGHIAPQHHLAPNGIGAPFPALSGHARQLASSRSDKERMLPALASQQSMGDNLLMCSSGCLTGLDVGMVAAAPDTRDQKELHGLLTCIGTELSRHGICVPDAIQAGWLGTLSPEHAAIIIEAHELEHRCLASNGSIDAVLGAGNGRPFSNSGSRGSGQLPATAAPLPLQAMAGDASAQLEFSALNFGFFDEYGAAGSALTDALKGLQELAPGEESQGPSSPLYQSGSSMKDELLEHEGACVIDGLPLHADPSSVLYSLRSGGRSTISSADRVLSPEGGLVHSPVSISSLSNERVMLGRTGLLGLGGLAPRSMKAVEEVARSVAAAGKALAGQAGPKKGETLSSRFSNLDLGTCFM